MTKTPAAGHRPMRVTARLEGGMACAGGWGLALDGILASILHHGAKAAALAAGHAPPPALGDPDPPDLDLPLARCTAGGTDWHWAATTAWPVDGHDLAPDPRYYSHRVDHNPLEVTAATLPVNLRAREGRYRHRWTPVLVTVCTAVTWTAVGDPAAVAALLEPVAAIGKKRAAGHGRVLAWTIEPAPDLAGWTAGHTHPDGTLGRPTPHRCLAGHPDVVDAGTGPAGLRPPYVHPSRQRILHLPTSPTAAGHGRAAPEDPLLDDPNTGGAG